MKYYSKLTGKMYANKGLRTIAENKYFADNQEELQSEVKHILAQLGAIQNTRGAINIEAKRKIYLCRQIFSDYGRKGLQMWEELKKDALALVQTNGLAFEQAQAERKAQEQAQAERKAQEQAKAQKAIQRTQSAAKMAVRFFL